MGYIDDRNAEYERAERYTEELMAKRLAEEARRKAGFDELRRVVHVADQEGQADEIVLSPFITALERLLAAADDVSDGFDPESGTYSPWGLDALRVAVDDAVKMVPSP